MHDTNFTVNDNPPHYDENYMFKAMDNRNDNELVSFDLTMS